MQKLFLIHIFVFNLFQITKSSWILLQIKSLPNVICFQIKSILKLHGHKKYLKPLSYILFLIYATLEYRHNFSKF